MYNERKFYVSFQDEAALDSYYIELYEKQEMKTVAEISEELDIKASVIYKYIKYCASEVRRITEFKRIICTTKFTSKHGEYIKIQKDYFEKRAEKEKLEKRRNAMMAAKKLYERQLERKQTSEEGKKYVK